jgi:putative lipoprotein
MSDIMAGHRNDSVNSAKIILYRQNNTSESAYHFNIPKNLVMLPSDSLQSFFANNRIPDNKTSFLATYNSTTNSYVFNNISGIVNLFMRHTNSANWGKVVVVPVELQTVTQGTGNNQQTKITKVSHEMGLTSTKLLGNSPGRNNIEISVIYSRFNGR